MRILSTKKLAPAQRELLLNAGVNVVEQNFISVVPLEFNVENLPGNIIFTSKNAVKMVLKKFNPEVLTSKNLFCVGEKTAGFLKEKDLPVKEMAFYGKDLAEKIVTEYVDEEFLFFCGKKRRPDLPNDLKQEGLNLTEIVVYDTIPLPKKIEGFFEGVLFFSPSAVKSFFSKNELKDSTAFCIGKTTASEVKKYTPNFITAKRPSIENVIVQVVKHFKST